MRFMDFFGGVGMMRIEPEQAGHDCILEFNGKEVKVRQATKQ